MVASGTPKKRFAPIGAGIQLTANAMKALGGLGLAETLRSEGFVPAAFHSREWDTANVTNVLIMGKSLEELSEDNSLIVDVDSRKVAAVEIGADLAKSADRPTGSDSQTVL